MPEFLPGVLPSLPRAKDYVAGAVTGLPDKILLADGDWRPYISQPHEMQLRFGVDFGLCTKFAATDVVECLMFFLFGTRPNYSERALAIMANQQDTNGDSLYNVAETIRTKGLVPEDLLPWTSDLVTFQKYKTITPEQLAAIEAAGRKWLEEYDFGWEWVYDDWGMAPTEALKRSPLYVATMYASESSRDANGVYHTDVPNSPMTTHAVGQLNQTPDKYKDIDDSYSVQLKRLSPDFRIPVGMRFHIAKKNPNPTPMFYPPKNSLVIVADTGERLMYVAGDQIYSDESGKILLEVEARNAKNGMSAPYPIVHVHAADIAHLKRIKLNGQPA